MGNYLFNFRSLLLILPQYLHISRAQISSELRLVHSSPRANILLKISMQELPLPFLDFLNRQSLQLNQTLQSLLNAYLMTVDLVTFGSADFSSSAPPLTTTVLSKPAVNITKPNTPILRHMEHRPWPHIILHIFPLNFVFPLQKPSFLDFLKTP